VPTQLYCVTDGFIHWFSKCCANNLFTDCVIQKCDCEARLCVVPFAVFVFKNMTNFTEQCMSTHKVLFQTIQNCSGNLQQFTIFFLSSKV
jgi:hypothetical protein